MQCIFCKIVAGEIPSFKIYDDDETLAFMDIKPFTKGHTLVIPKQHAENIFEISIENLQKVAATGKKVAERLKEVLHVDGIRLSQSNGKIAGQEIMHFHLHVIPRYNDDGLSVNLVDTRNLPQADMEELRQLAEKLKM